MKMEVKMFFFFVLCLGGVASRHTHTSAINLKSQSGFPTLPSLAQLLGASSDDITGDFGIADGCDATISKADTMYQISSSPANCMNFANLLALILPEDQGNFAMDSPGFMALEKIIVRSLSFDKATKMVDIAASYSGTVSIIPGILTISNINLQIEFASTHSDSWRFDISASLTIGSVTIDVSITRNDEGYFLSADTEDSVSASDIASIFKTGDSFLPATGLEDKLQAANLNTFSIGQPRIKAVFTEGWGVMFGGKISILSWDPFDVNLLINKPNDKPMSITIAVYTPTFSLSKMFSDLFDIDVRNVPVIGTAEIENLALVISTQEVETPLVILDLGYTDMFDLPYRKGVKASFDINIIDVLVSVSILITPAELRLTVSQPGDLTLRKVINSFLAGETGLISGEGGDSSLNNWPSFIKFDPLAISLTLLDVAATKDKDTGWGMNYFEINLKMTEPITFFNDVISINDLAFDMTWSKTTEGSVIAGVISGKVVIGSSENVSPSVDIRIPFPFANEEITFTFTDFSIHSVGTAFGFHLPTDSFEFLTQLELNKIALAFNDAGKLNRLTVEAGIPTTWPIFGDFSVGKIKFFIEIDNMAESAERTWLFRLSGHIIISSCDVFVSATLGSDLVEVIGKGTNCDVSIRDLLNSISVNPDILPSLITGFTLSEPVFSFRYDRTSPKKSIGFGATTSLFGSSDAEVAFVSTGSTSAIVAGFAVQSANAIPAISFLSDFGLSDMAIMYVSQRITMAPYQWGKPIFNNYAPTDTELNSGLTLYARFVPTPTNMMGKLLGEAGEASIEVSLNFPNLVFKLDIKMGEDGIPLGNGGGRFVSMGLEISRQLIGLNLKFKLVLKDTELTFTGKLTFTFGGTVTISLLMEGVWREPLGIQNFEIHRMGLALGINLVTLVPSFGLTGEIRVTPPGRTAIQAGLTICVDVANPLSTVFEVHFSRLLLQDIANVFMGREVPLPTQIGEMGFPDEVRIFISPAGNLDCFGRAYDAGVEIKGTFQIPFLQVYAKADIKVKLKPIFQLKADLELHPIIYGNGLLKIVSAQSDSIGAYLKMNIGSSDEFLIDGSCKVVLFGASISIQLRIDKERLFFKGRLNLWNIFQVELEVDLRYGTSSPSLHVIGKMQNDLFTKIKQRATQGIRNGARAINQKIESAQVKIRNAEREVDKIRGSIRYHERRIEDAKNDCRRAPWYRKWVCIGTGARIIYHGVIIGALWTAWAVARGVLKVADLFLEGVKLAIKVGAAVLSTLVNAVLSIIDIQYVRFEVYLTSTRKTFQFEARVVIMGWTFEPRFSINFSSRRHAESGINSAGDSVSKKTLDKVE